MSNKILPYHTILINIRDRNAKKNNENIKKNKELFFKK